MSKNETRNHILDTAIELFWRKSYHGVNMNELSRTAGVNKATVYQHFASKEKLAVAAVERAAKRNEDDVFLSTFSETKDPKKRLEGIYQKVFAMQTHLHNDEGQCMGCPFVNLGIELSTSSEPVRDAVNKAFASYRTYYAQIIDAHWQNNTSGDEDKQTIISTLLANMNGAIVATKLENRPQAVLEGHNRAVQILGM